MLSRPNRTFKRHTTTKALTAFRRILSSPLRQLQTQLLSFLPLSLLRPTLWQWDYYFLGCFGKDLFVRSLMALSNISQTE